MKIINLFIYFLMICTANSYAADQRPNILFILTDNQAASLLGTYGNPDIKTPHIDQLASEGIKFTQAFAVNGMCSPTRATLMTGLMPSQHGIHNWLDDALLEEWPKDWSAVAEFRTLPLTLKNRGYKTAMIGKWHLGQPWKASIGYQHWVTFPDGHTVNFWDNTVIENEKTYQVKDKHIVDYFTDKAVEYLQNHDGENPFYLQLNYDGPYTNPPTNSGPARNRFYQQYVGHDFTSFPRNAYNQNLIEQLVDKDTNDFFREKLREGLEMHNDPETMANVASQNTLVDDGVGRVLKVLRDKGLDENTLIIFSSDQGNFYGQHGLWQHTNLTTPSSMYETAMNIPLIIKHPGRIGEREITATLIGQYDIPVTILDYLDINDVKFNGSPGKSFKKILLGEASKINEAVFFEQEETRVIRTREFSYWKRLDLTGHSELYDMRSDPGQLTNVYNDPKYRKVIDDLDKELNKFFNQYRDKEYDLWTGGSAKGTIARREIFQKLYGQEWQPTAEVKPAFTE